MKDFLKKYWLLIIAEIVAVLIFVIFYGKFGDVIVDSYREVYIPQQMLRGKLLYRDIFCIYPPLAYLLNALLFVIFGAGVKVLKSAALLSTMGIIFFVYKISEKFMDKFAISGILLFLTGGALLASNVFSPLFPYSFGMLYGILFILGGIYFALEKKFPLAYFLYALAVCSKFELILALPAFIWASKTVDWKKNLTALLIPPAFITAVLFLLGIRLDDIKTTFDLINIVSSTKSLYWFYSSMGLVFRWELLPIYAENILKFILPVKPVLYQEAIIWAFPVILVLYLARFKKLSAEAKIVIAASLLASAKVFFAETLQSYGVFYLPLCLISLMLVIPERFKKILAIYFIIWGLIAGFNNAKTLYNKTDIGVAKTAEYFKTAEKGKVVVYPEGLSINILSGRESDNKFYSLIPMNVEGFGEELISKRIEITKPEYIVINNYDTSAYYFKNFGKDYAREIFKYIENNYELKAVIRDILEYKIYRLKH